jgi:hypothetical protein
MEKYDKRIIELETSIEKLVDDEAHLQLKLDQIDISYHYDKFSLNQ